MRQPQAIFKALVKTYPEADCELDFESPFQLLVATVLSAQCTDKRVNFVSHRLFKKFGTPKKLAGADIAVVEEMIHSLGFFRVKAQNIKALSQKLLQDFDGEVPSNIHDLVTLPGVGRKTANVVLGHAFGIPGITVDTHFGRLSRRFGWSNSQDPVVVERDVSVLFPEKDWTDLSQLLIWHGRRICHSRKPACGACPLARLCPSVGIGEMDRVKALALVKSDEDFR
ncbi:unannotated protein [freshwater metagenome]|uniref:Unannotated protein n=1 Tax=freshwater metagenome TaxID=449393 RepID=A0A6J7QA43_9ZZZZ|nr:endonuclease III [Actinomycetota bacterium]